VPTNIKNRKLAAAFFTVLCLLPRTLAQAANIDQLDDFEDNTLQGWAMGVPTVTENFMSIVADGGPDGVGDSYLAVRSDSSIIRGGGQRLTFFNRQQWAGNYTAAGITAIAMDLKNFSTDQVLNMRLAVNGGFGSASTGGVTGGVFISNSISRLEVGSGWTRAVFSLLPDDLIAISGGIGGNTTGNDVAATLANVQELRLLNSETDSWSGLTVTASVGVDNVHVVPLPPAFAMFGSALMALVAFLLGRKNWFFGRNSGD
jgi:hypothetical protein